MAFGKDIKRLRKLANLSTGDLAALLGVDAKKLKKWERKDATPRDSDIELVEKAFGLSLNEIKKLEKLPLSFNGSFTIKDAAGSIINQLIAVEAKLNILISLEAERVSIVTAKSAPDVLEEMNAAALLEAHSLKDVLRQIQ